MADSFSVVRGDEIFLDDLHGDVEGVGGWRGAKRFINTRPGGLPENWQRNDNATCRAKEVSPR